MAIKAPSASETVPWPTHSLRPDGLRHQNIFITDVGTIFQTTWLQYSAVEEGTFGVLGQWFLTDSLFQGGGYIVQVKSQADQPWRVGSVESWGYREVQHMLLWSPSGDLSHIFLESLHNPKASLFCHLTLSLHVPPVASFSGSIPHIPRASCPTSCRSGRCFILNIPVPDVCPSVLSFHAGWVV